MMGDTSLFSSRTGAKGLAKGSGAGKGKGKGKLLPGQLALEDDKPPKTDDQLINEALNKAKKARDLAQSTVANIEHALISVKGSKFWTKAAAKDAGEVLVEVQQAGDGLKKFITKPIMDEALIKGKIMDVGLIIKKGQNLVKEINGLCNKAGSVAASSKSRKV